MLGDIVLAHGVCAAEAAEKGLRSKTMPRIWWCTARSIC